MASTTTGAEDEVVGVSSNPRTQAQTWLASKGNVTVAPSGFVIDDVGRNKQQIFRRMWLDYIDQLQLANMFAKRNGTAKPSPISSKDLEQAFEECLEDIGRELRNEVRKKLSFDADVADKGLTELASWLASIVQDAKPHYVTIMQHWLWQVKRNMNRKSIVFPIMPVLMSPKQKIGKSYSISKLIEPLRSSTLNADASQITDNRQYAAYSTHLICFLDEMANIDRTDVACLKRLISNPMVSYRPMRTNDVYEIEQRCSFIGTSNKPVNQLITDSTGMRRFFELPAREDADWDAINTIDYVSIWKGIDENLERGYHEGDEEAIEAEQAYLVAEDPIDMFIADSGIKAPSNASKEEPKEVRGSKIYEAYVRWCEENGYKTLASGTFGKRLKSIGISSRRDGRGVIYYIDVSSSFDSKAEIKVIGVRK